MLLPDQDIHDFIFLSQLYTSCFGTGEENVFYSRLLVFHVHTCTLTLNGELIALKDPALKDPVNSRMGSFKLQI